MDREHQKYLNFSVNDFVWDDFFRSWINNPTTESDLFWTTWILDHPESSAKITLARQIVQSVQVKNTHLDSTEIEHQITCILIRRATEENTPKKRKTFKILHWRLGRIAAIFIVLAGIGLSFYFLNGKGERVRTIATGSGVQKTILLSDSSSIILNGNSSLSFKKSWGASQAREVWLDGEGYFEVKHLDKDRQIENHERFLVHVKGVTVEVLGTVFNIRNRRSKTEIVLREGKIRLVFENRIHPDIIMKPEEIVTIDDKHPKNIAISVVKPDDYSSWIHQRLVLDNSRLESIIQYIEDNYGKKVIVSDSSLLNKRIEGTLMLDNLDDALFILSKVLKVKVRQDATSIYFLKM